RFRMQARGQGRSHRQTPTANLSLLQTGPAPGGRPNPPRRAACRCAGVGLLSPWVRRPPPARYHVRPDRPSPRSPPVNHDDDARNGVPRAQAEDAVRTLLQWAGEDPAREGLLDTPRRVVNAYTEWFSGYGLDPDEYMARTFKEVAGYDEMIVLRDIEFESHCEHHMAP